MSPRHFSLLSLAALLLCSTSAFAQVVLGTAQNFAVLGGSAVTNTGSTVVTGELGVWPTPTVTGFPPGIVQGGTIHLADAVAQQAQSDLTAAYNSAANLACTTTLTGQDLGGLTLTPGVYCYATSAQLTGTVTLDFQGNPNALFVFKIGSTLTTASSSSVAFIDTGGSTCPPNVFWQVGSSATLGTTTSFGGNILALTSITANTGATVNGRLLARNGAVTLATNTVSVCAGGQCPAITISPATLPPSTVGTPYNQTISASGGVGPYTFAVSAGALPTGLTLNATTGAITGTPTATGTFNFTITATDSTQCTASRAYALGGVFAAVLPVPTLGFAGLALTALLMMGGMMFVVGRR